MNAQGTLLAQIRPGDTADHAAYTNSLPSANRGLNAEVTLIVVANTTGSAATCRVYHNNAGTTYSQVNAIYYDKNVPANDSIVLSFGSENAGIAVKPGGSIGVHSGSANALTFSLYGVVQQNPTQ